VPGLPVGDQWWIAVVVVGVIVTLALMVAVGCIVTIICTCQKRRISEVSGNLKPFWVLYNFSEDLSLYKLHTSL